MKYADYSKKQLLDRIEELEILKAQYKSESSILTD